MDILAHLNWPAVAAAAVAGFVTGAVWYGVFAKPWMAAAGRSDDDVEPKVSTYVFAGVLQLVMAVTIAVIIAQAGIASWLGGAGLGFVIGIGLVTANKALNAAFQGTSRNLVVIDGLHAAVAFAVMGGILGGWQ